MPRIARFAFLLAVGVSTTFAQQPDSVASSKSNTAFVLSSPAFAQGAEIPAGDTCKGADQSPPLQWQGSPAHVAGFALVLDDPDAPGKIFVHWVVWNLPSSAHSLPAAVPKREKLDDGTLQGRNDFQRLGYSGPCPPPGAAHRYVFHLYALDRKIELAPGASRADLDAAMKGHILAEAEYSGTFHR